MTSVEIDIFSGRPNPAWTLSADDSAAWLRLTEQLPAGAAPATADLGYRGFLVTDDDGGVTRVFSGTLTLPDGRHVADSKAAERWLFDRARSQGHGELVDAIGPR